MPSLNRVTLIGHLGADPELHITQNREAIATIRLATTETSRDKSTGARKESTEWHRKSGRCCARNSPSRSRREQPPDPRPGLPGLSRARSPSAFRKAAFERAPWIIMRPSKSRSLAARNKQHFIHPAGDAFPGSLCGRT